MTTYRTAQDELSLLAANILLYTGAVMFRPEPPFPFSPGLASPIYVNCRKALSFPLARMRLSIYLSNESNP